jgi:L-ascorbate metabolism protein UlaG (beta-lactamase superfamily)
LGAGRALAYEQDVIATDNGPLAITFIRHASLAFNFNGRLILVDPVAKMGDYSGFTAVDLILITHEHRDHFDPALIKRLRRPGTKVVLTSTCAALGVSGIVMRNGEQRRIMGLDIKAVPAYNLLNRRPNGEPYHPRGIGNGYIINFGGQRLYVAGDTENTPELRGLKNISIAFLPMQMPYTMTPAMVADAALAIRPKILYPYHLGETDPRLLLPLLDGRGIDVRIRNMP